MSVGSAIGGFFGGIAKGLTGSVIEKATDIVDKMVTDKDLAAKIKHEFETQQLITAADLEKAQLAAETQIQVAQETTHQAELNQSDIYTKQTRPKIARQSWYVSGAYAITCFASEFAATLIKAFSTSIPADVLNSLHGVAFQWEVYLAAAAPALTYMGVRSFDIWRAGGAKRI